MAAGFERTRYVLSRLGARPVYYIWEKEVVKGQRGKGTKELNWWSLMLWFFVGMVRMLTQTDLWSI